MPTEHGELLDGIEIFRAGAHTASDGSTRAWTEDDLEKIASSYDPAFHEAPVVVGHPENDKPAFGWVKALKRSGDRLLATLDLVPEFVETVRAGLFKKRSASIYQNLDGKGPYLRHVGFLGAVPPAVKALADINLSDCGEFIAYQFSQQEEGHMSWKDKVKTLFTQAVDEIPEGGQTIQVVQPEGAKPKQFSEEEVTAREKAAAETAAKKAKEEAAAEFAEKQKMAEAGQKAALHKAEVKTKIEAMVNSKDGKVIPAMVKAGLIEFAQSLPFADDQTVEFSEGDKKIKKTPCDWFLDTFLPALPKQVECGEIATRETDPGKGDAAAKLEQLTRKKMEAEKLLSYSDAFMAVQIENPGLAKEYQESIGH